MPRNSKESMENIKFKRAKKVEKGFDAIFDEPFGEKRQDNRTQKQKDKELLDNFKKKYLTDGLEETKRKSPNK